MTGLRAVLRLAARECRRRPWRSLLVVALIALPAAAAIFVSTWLHTAVDSPQQQFARTFGQADLVARVSGPNDLRALRHAVADRPGWRSVEVVYRTALIEATGTTARRRVRAATSSAPIGDPLTKGMVALAAGRIPSGPSEVAVDAALLRRLGLTVGDALTFVRPAKTVVVSGVLVGGVNGGSAVVGPGLAAAQADSNTVVLIDVPQGVVAKDVLPQSVLPLINSRAELMPTGGYGRQNDTLFLYLFGGLGIAAFGLIVASALAIGARRQLRALGLFGATGASPAQARALVLAQGGVLGLAGALVGVGLGVATAMLSRPAVEDYAGHPEGALQVDVSDCVGIGLLALIVAVAAAWLPARIAAGTSVLHALGGRRPLVRLGARVPVVGVVVSAIGGFVLASAAGGSLDGDARTVLGTFGSVLIGAGLVICAPYVVGLLERFAGATSGTLRLAARTVARQRSRTGPTVAAIMAATALALAVATVAWSIRGTGSSRILSDLPADVVEINAQSTTANGSVGSSWDCGQIRSEVAPLLTHAVPSAHVECLTAQQIFVSSDPQTGAGDSLVVLRPADLDLVGLGAYAGSLEAGKALHPLFDGSDVPVASSRLVASLSVVDIPVGTGNWWLTRNIGLGTYIVSPETARQAELTNSVMQTTAYARVGHRLTGAERIALNDLSASDPGAQLSTAERDVYVSFNYDTPPSRLTDIAFVTYAIVLPAAIVLALLTALIGLALTAVETREEQATFVAVGAGPAHRRRQNAWQAFLVIGLGVLLALPGGLMSAAIVLHAAEETVRPAWPFVLAIIVGLPLLGALGAAVFTRGGMSPIQRRSV